ncbi:hypothetical protein H8957_008369 [Semnopithecus entellus]
MPASVQEAGDLPRLGGLAGEERERGPGRDLGIRKPGGGAGGGLARAVCRGWDRPPGVAAPRSSPVRGRQGRAEPPRGSAGGAAAKTAPDSWSRRPAARDVARVLADHGRKEPGPKQRRAANKRRRRRRVLGLRAGDWGSCTASRGLLALERSVEPRLLAAPRSFPLRLPRGDESAQRGGRRLPTLRALPPAPAAQPSPIRPAEVPCPRFSLFGNLMALHHGLSSFCSPPQEVFQGQMPQSPSDLSKGLRTLGEASWNPPGDLASHEIW